MDQTRQVAEMQNQLNLAVVQMLQQQIQKTCFEKCFPNGQSSFPDSLGKPDQICLAKCMDRMIEAHSIVVKASTEMAQNLQTQ
ncbi:unnamed protein product [Amoebophrya sp. A120]|nr:unnamed protein product [Amoebophrya sp. A120]|eukprot:GSA120T00006333001.1